MISSCTFRLSNLQHSLRLDQVSSVETVTVFNCRSLIGFTCRYKIIVDYFCHFTIYFRFFSIANIQFKILKITFHQKLHLKRELKPLYPTLKMINICLAWLIISKLTARSTAYKEVAYFTHCRSLEDTTIFRSCSTWMGI